MKTKEFIYILASIFVVTILWVTFTIYHNLTTSTIEDPLSIQILPINGTFDIKTLSAIKTRQQINPDYEIKVVSGSDNLTNPTPTPEVASESAQPTPEEEITPEAQLPEQQ